MKGRVAFFVLMLCVPTAEAQRATSASGIAKPDSGNAAQACAAQCEEQGRRCGAYAGSAQGSKAVEARHRECLRQGQACAARCSASAVVAPPIAPIAPSPVVPENAPLTMEPTTSLESPEDTSSAQVEALLRSFMANEAARLRQADQATFTTLKAFLDLLCKTSNVPGQTCTTGRTGATPFPPLLPRFTDPRVSDRYRKDGPEPSGGGDQDRAGRLARLMPPVPTGGSPAASPAPPSGSGKGCWLIDTFRVLGMGCDRCVVNTSILPGFENDGRGPDLIVRNGSTSKPAWVGLPTPLNVEIPPRAGYDGRGEIRIPLAIYRAKNDYRPLEIMIRIKHWKDFSEECAARGVAPGPTTLEEWGNPHGPRSTE